MTRDLSAAVLSAIQSGHVRPVLFIEGEWESGFVRATTSPRDLVFEGNTYSGKLGNLLSIEPVEETMAFNAPEFTITLNGINDTIIALILEEEYVGNPLKVYIGFLDAEDVLVDDPFLFFEGVMDGMDFVDSFSGGTSSASIRVTFIFSRFEQRGGRKTNPAEHKILYPGDAFFDSVPELTEKLLEW